MASVLYEMLTGKRLFAGEAVSDALAAELKRTARSSGPLARRGRSVSPSSSSKTR